MTILAEYLKENRALAYSVASANTKRNKDGRPVISADDDWVDETEWDDMFQVLMQERQKDE